MRNRPVSQLIDTAIIRPSNATSVQASRALIVSCFAAGIDVAGLYLLHQQAGMPVIFSATISYLVGGILQYVLCSVWVFPVAPSNAVRGFTAFTLLSLVGLGITDGTIWLLSKHWGLNFMLAKVVALGLTFCWNFISRKYLLFRTADTNSLLGKLGSARCTPPAPRQAAGDHRQTALTDSEPDSTI